LYDYAQSYEGQRIDDATAQNILNILLLAHQLAPQVGQISFATADMLLEMNRPAEAVPMLRAIAYDPHAGQQSADRAKAMLTQAENAARAQAPAPAASETPPHSH